MNTTAPVQPAFLHPSDSISEATGGSVESGIEKILRTADGRIHQARERCRSAVRRNPERSVLIAAAGGYLFRRLPVASLLAVGVKLAGACAPPTLIALGI